MVTDWITAHRLLVRLLAVAVPAALAAALAVVREGMTPSTAATVLVLAVVAAAATGDRGAGVLAALTAAAGFDLFLTAPYLSLTIDHRDDLELAVVLVVVGLAVTELALWGLRQQSVARRRGAYLEGVLDLGGVTLRASEVAARQSIAVALASALDVDRVEWVAGPPAPDTPTLDRTGRVWAGGRDLQVGQRGLPTDRVTAVPAGRGGERLGHFRVVSATRVVRPDLDQLRAALLLAEQLRQPSAGEPVASPADSVPGQTATSAPTSAPRSASRSAPR